MSGGKGGSSTSSVSIPPWLESATKENLAKAKQASEIGYMPYYGPDVAAQNANQLLANQATYDAAAAFGLAPQGGNANAGVPVAQQYAGGITGYSSGDLFDQARQELATRRPAQYGMYESMFVDPLTGVVPVTYEGGSRNVNQDFVSQLFPMGDGGSDIGGGQVASRTQLNDYGYIDPFSPQGMIIGAMPGGGVGLTLNNTEAVKTLQRAAGMPETGLLDRIGVDPRSSVGTLDIGGYDYTINSGGGLSADGKTGLTAAEARRRASAQDWLYSNSGDLGGPSSLGGGGSFDPSGTGGGNFSGTDVGGGLNY
jgi:hypothetical protein